MDRLQAVIWDMDGTLIDSGTVVPDAFIATVRAITGSTYTRQQIIDVYHSRLGAIAAQIQPYPQIASVLAGLHGRLPMAVFTGASGRAARLLLKATGLLEFLAVVVAGDQVARQKPEPDGVVRACELLGVPPHRACYVADAPIDLEAARRAGVVAVAAGWGHQYQSSAPAQVVLQQPQELLERLGVG
jgi:HAD superfamily hydrolase (TIGR01509 family)